MDHLPKEIRFTIRELELRQSVQEYIAYYISQRTIEYGRCDKRAFQAIKRSRAKIAKMINDGTDRFLEDYKAGKICREIAFCLKNIIRVLLNGRKHLRMTFLIISNLKGIAISAAIFDLSRVSINEGVKIAK